MSMTELRVILDGAVDAFAAAQTPKLKVAHENVPFQPPQGVLYLEATLLPAATRAAGVGEASPDYMRGVFQVTVIAPVGKSYVPAVSVADALRAHFPRGQAHVAGKTRLTVERASLGPGRIDVDRYRLPVSIDFYAYMEI